MSYLHRKHNYNIIGYDRVIWIVPGHHQTDCIDRTSAKIKRYYDLSFYEDILCGDPFSAPSGAQLPTEPESDMERDRR